MKKEKAMSTILIKSGNKSEENFILNLAKILKAPVKVLNDNEELDALLIKSIEQGMKSGKASKTEVKKFFEKNGVRIH